LVFCAVFCAIPIYACSQNTADYATGGACSIKELNNLEKAEKLQANADETAERDLRPVKIVPKNVKFNEDYCVYGSCLRKKILGY